MKNFILAAFALVALSGTASAAPLSANHFSGAFTHPDIIKNEIVVPDAPAIIATVNLTWTDSNPAGTTWNARRGTTATACTPTATATDTCTLLNTLPLTVKTFVDNPALGSKYWYYVRSSNPNLLGANGVMGGESLNSSPAIVTLTGVTPPTLNCTITITGGVVNGTCQ